MFTLRANILEMKLAGEKMVVGGGGGWGHSNRVQLFDIHYVVPNGQIDTAAVVTDFTEWLEEVSEHPRHSAIPPLVSQYGGGPNML